MEVERGLGVGDEDEVKKKRNEWGFPTCLI